jgi:cyclic pyranopterin phosphate synthase
VTATGTVYGCLGQDQKIELRDLMRAGAPLDPALDALMLAKPKGHDFHIEAPRPAVARHMSVTGG